MTKAEKEKLEKDPQAYVEALIESHNSEVESLKAAHASEVETLKAKLEESMGSDNRGVVKGSFKSTDGKTYQFKKGFVKVIFKGTAYNSEDLISDKELAPVMESLIEIGFGGLEEVKSNS